MPEFRARYEFKYLVDAEQAEWVRRLTSMYCEPDSYGEAGAYDVTSLYFDTSDWLTAMQTVEGQRNRFKLRVRTYGFEPQDPVFLEIKGRVGTTIVKSRAHMARTHVDALCSGSAPPPDGFRALKASHQDDLERFRNRMDSLDMRPRLWVRYKREAWGSAFGDGARLTFDSELQVQAPDVEHPFTPYGDDWLNVQLEGPPIIIEMKFNGAYPFWMQRIVHGLHLRRVSCSKYVQGAEQLGLVPWNLHEREAPWTVF